MITINGYPTGTTVMPVYNPIEYSLSSNNVSQSNFKYICDIYPAGSTYPIRLKQPPHPVNGYTVFDVAYNLRDFINRDCWGYTDTVFNDCSNSYNNFTIKFGEEYGASSAVTTYPNLATDSSRFAINGAFSFNKFVASAYSGYIIGSVARKFLTSRQRIEITTDEKYQLYFLNGNTSGTTAYNCVCESYNSSGVLIQTLTFGTSFSTSNKMQRVCVGSSDLNNMTGAELRYSISSGLPFVDSNVSYYDVYLTESLGARITEKKRFYIVEDCNVHTTYTLVFQNKFGGYDSFAFKSASDKNSVMTTSEFKKRLGAWNDAQYSYSHSDRGRTQHTKFNQDGIKLRSDNITEDESAWLKELIISTDVRILSDDYSAYIPVVVTSNNYMEKEYAKDGLFNLEVDIEYSTNRVSQQW